MLTNSIHYLLGSILGFFIFYGVINPISESNPLVFSVGESFIDMDPIQYVINIAYLYLVLVVASLFSSYTMLKKPVTKLIWD